MPLLCARAEKPEGVTWVCVIGVKFPDPVRCDELVSRKSTTLAKLLMMDARFAG